MVSTDPVEAEALFDARRLAYPACSSSAATPCSPRTSACPRGQLAEMLARIEEIAATHDILIANIAHAGDGNLHPC